MNRRDNITRVDGIPMTDDEYDRVERSFITHQLRKKLKRNPTQKEVDDLVNQMQEWSAKQS